MYIHWFPYTVESVSLTLDGSNIANDSYVSIDSVGEGSEALLCHTDKRFCCARKGHQAGEWYFPNASIVEIQGTANLTSRSYLYRNRGNQIVRLNRAMNPPERGRFFCKVPDNNNVTQIIYVNIGKNEYWICYRPCLHNVLTSILYNSENQRNKYHSICSGCGCCRWKFYSTMHSLSATAKFFVQTCHFTFKI